MTLRVRNVRAYALPPARFPVSDLRKLQEVIVGLFPSTGPDKFEISFRGLNGQEMVATDTLDIESEDPFIPAVLIEPTIAATKRGLDGEITHSVRLEQKVTSTTTNTSTTSVTYELTMETQESTWLAHSERIVAWFRQRQHDIGVHRFYNAFALALLAVSIYAIFDSVASKPDRIINYYTFYFGVGGVFLAGLAFVKAGDLFPRLAIDVRETRSPVTLTLIITILTALGTIIGITNGVVSLLVPHR